MRILVVGGAGYIGSHVCRAFEDRGDTVAVLDDFSSGSRINTPKSREVFEGSILDYSFLKKALSLEWDGVVHLAAFKAAGESMTAPEKFSLNNINGTVNLLNALCETGTAPLVFSSSAAIFGEPQYLPIDENHPCAPENFYGYTKLMIEELLDWYGRLKHLRSAALRYFNAAGYDPQGRIREPEKNPQNLLPVLMEAAAGIRKEVRVFGNDYDTPDGTCIRDYIHVSDLACAHVLAMDYLLSESKSLKVNLGSGVGLSVLQMVEKAQSVSGAAFPVIMAPRREGDPANLVASSEQAEKILGWKAEFSGAETLVSTSWELYKNNGE